MHRITLIPGDGIGPEVASNVVRIIEASGVEIQWETHYAGAQALEKFGETLPQELLDSILRNKVALKGPITTPIGTHGRFEKDTPWARSGYTVGG